MYVCETENGTGRSVAKKAAQQGIKNFNIKPERFRETENRIRGFAFRIREVRNREERTVNIIVSVDQKQLHRLDRIN